MSKDKKSGLEDVMGFQDFMDSLANPAAHPPIKRKSQYDLQGYLSTNVERLRRLSMLLEEKRLILEQYPQLDKLVAMQIERNHLFEQSIVESLISPQSPLQISLAQIVNKFFRKR